MKRKICNTPEYWGKTKGELSISFAKSGKIAFSKAISKVLGLQINDYVGFSQDKDSPRDWYVKKILDKTKGHKQVQGTRTDKKYPVLYIHSAGIAKDLRASLNISGTTRSVRFPV